LGTTEPARRYWTRREGISPRMQGEGHKQDVGEPLIFGGGNPPPRYYTRANKCGEKKGGTTDECNITPDEYKKREKAAYENTGGRMEREK